MDFKKKLLIVLCVTMLLGMVFLSGCSEREDTFTIKVTDIDETQTGQQVELDIRNKTGNKLSFGWVRSCEILVTTDEDEYSFDPPSGNIPQGHSELVLNLPECEGEIEKITITDLRLLDEGLPEHELKDITIYNTKKDVDSYTGTFPRFSMQDIAFIAAPALMVLILVTFVVLAIRTKIKNRKAMQQFSPFAAPYPDAQFQWQHQQATDMHNQAHQQANAMHQQAVQQHINDQTMQFAQQSVTPIDQGGFTPPPPPPPPPTGF